MLHFYKTINENVKFYGRLNGENDPYWMRYRIDVKLPYDMSLRVGKFCWDWESDLYWVSPPGSWQTDAVMSDYTLKGYQLTKDFSMGTAKFILSRNDTDSADEEYLMYGADFELNFNDMLSAQLAYTAQDPEGDADTLSTWWIAPKVDFGNSIALKGAYYQQDNDNLNHYGISTSPSLWKTILTVDQKTTGFSSFWVEYSQTDAGFYYNQSASYAFVASFPSTYIDYLGLDPLGWGGMLTPTDLNIFQIMAAQKWSDKWDTWFRYADYDFDGTLGDISADATNYTVGIDYLYSDAVRFELLYDKIDADYNATDDSVINFRTAIYF